MKKPCSKCSFALLCIFVRYVLPISTACNVYYLSCSHEPVLYEHIIVNTRAFDIIVAVYILDACDCMYI